MGVNNFFSTMPQQNTSHCFPFTLTKRSCFCCYCKLNGKLCYFSTALNALLCHFFGFVGTNSSFKLFHLTLSIEFLFRRLLNWCLQRHSRAIFAFSPSSLVKTLDYGMWIWLFHCLRWLCFSFCDWDENKKNYTKHVKLDYWQAVPFFFLSALIATILTMIQWQI